MGRLLCKSHKLCVALVLWSSLVQAQDITTGLLGAWYLDDGSGSTATDNSGNGRPGTLVNSPAWTSGCQVNGCLTFNGTTQYVSLGDPAAFAITTGDVTLAAWVNVTNAPGTNLAAGIVGRADNGTAVTRLVSLYISGNPAFPGKAIFQLYDGTNGPAVLSNLSIVGTGWRHVAGTRTGGTLRFYIDGVEQTDSPNTDTAGNCSSTGLIWLIGRRADSGGASLDGKIDEVHLYGRALTGPDVVALRDATHPGGPVGEAPRRRLVVQ